MTAILEISCAATADCAVAALDWCAQGPARVWRALPGIMAVDRYRPAAGPAKDPMVHDPPGPLLMLMLEFADADALDAAVRTDKFAGTVATLPAGVVATASALDRRHYSVAGETPPRPLTAPFSYSVRYHRPADDEKQFVEFYLANHAPLLAQLPGVRNVMCYLPLQCASATGLPGVDYMLGNEVTFDSIGAFNMAMASQQRLALRADFERFPPFGGRNTHYPMDRVRLFG